MAENNSLSAVYGALMRQTTVGDRSDSRQAEEVDAATELDFANMVEAPLKSLGSRQGQAGQQGFSGEDGNLAAWERQQSYEETDLSSKGGKAEQQKDDVPFKILLSNTAFSLCRSAINRDELGEKKKEHGSSYLDKAKAATKLGSKNRVADKIHALSRDQENDLKRPVGRKGQDDPDERASMVPVAAPYASRMASVQGGVRQDGAAVPVGSVGTLSGLERGGQSEQADDPKKWSDDRLFDESIDKVYGWRDVMDAHGQSTATFKLDAGLLEDVEVSLKRTDCLSISFKAQKQESFDWLESRKDELKRRLDMRLDEVEAIKLDIENSIES